jgi:lysophospholipase L1-like esterase
MPLGDSITQADRAHASYRYWLWKELQAKGYAVDFVGSHTVHHLGPAPRWDFDRDHEGHWGWRTDQILERLDGWLEEARPDVVLVHLGHNDLFQQQGVENVIEELAEVVSRLRRANPQVTVLLAQVIPTHPASPEIDRLAGAIGDLAARLHTPASPVTAVTLHQGFEAQRRTYDGVHPNEAGERFMAKGWMQALEPYLPDEPPPE